jgi:hypothetical protein
VTAEAITIGGAGTGGVGDDPGGPGADGEAVTTLEFK